MAQHLLFSFIFHNLYDICYYFLYLFHSYIQPMTASVFDFDFLGAKNLAHRTVWRFIKRAHVSLPFYIVQQTPIKLSGDVLLFW